MGSYSGMNDEFLRKTYVPDVYQHSITDIDYRRLWDRGIRVISFDIDDTIADGAFDGLSRVIISLFEELNNIGFKTILITNNDEHRGEHFSKKLGIPYLADAEKPHTSCFARAQEIFGVEKSQMAHVGNSMMDDVAGANQYGITSCLVRSMGMFAGLVGSLHLQKTRGQKIREELKKRKIWRKHHKKHEGDQYYQLGEVPAYRR